MHYNDSINRLPNLAVPDSVANALHYASDHLPVSGRFVFGDSPVSVSTADLATEFVFYQNYPNSFNPNTIISFSIPRSGHVTLKIFDILGQEVIVLADGVVPAGRHDLQWKADGAGGVYVYRLMVDGSVVSKKMLFLK